MIEIIKAIILGIVEGVTEFLPISSTGHLIVVSTLLQFDAAIRDTFDIFIQIGAVVAVIAFYRADIVRQVSNVTKDRSVQRFWLNIVIAFIPAAVIGFLFNDKIDALLFKPSVVAIMLIVGGVIFLIIEQQRIAEKATTHDLPQVSPRQALIIGVAQIFSLIPGVSRSGASIVGGMLSGLDRPTATQFSFYLAIPTLGIATIYSLLKEIKTIQGSEWIYLIVGAIVSGIVAWIAVRWLLSYISHNSFRSFGYYRILAGIVIIVLLALSLLNG